MELWGGALGRQYNGIDLSLTQIQANKQQYIDIAKEYSDIIEPNWVHGNSLKVKQLIPDKKFNLIFSCPPYFDLEVYSTDYQDLSYKDTYEDFLVDYRKIIKESCDLLENDSFAIFVVGNVRNSKNGGYYDLAGDTIRAFQDCGLLWYNDCILINTAGTLPLRVPIQFNATRKIGKQHQNYLVFYKGNPKNIKEKFGMFEQDDNEVIVDNI